MKTLRCVVCRKKTAPITCHHCNISKYCSSKCLDIDKPVHEKICHQFAEFLANNTRPAPTDSASLKLAVLLKEDSTDLQFLWVECERKDAEVGGYWYETFNAYTYIIPGLTPGPDIRGVDRMMIGEHMGPKFNLGHVIELWLQAEFMGNGAKPKKYAQNLLIGERK